MKEFKQNAGKKILSESADQMKIMQLEIENLGNELKSGRNQ